MSVRRQRFYGECMNVALEKIIHRGVDQAVAGHRRYAAKCLGDDPNSKMTLASGGTGVTLVQVTLVLHRQLDRSKAVLQYFAQPRRPIL
jgi:hypothetical protein